MMQNYTAFDLEISTEIPSDSEDWKAFRPLGISCAATLTNEGDLKLWTGIQDLFGYAPAMSPEQVGHLVRYLERQQANGSVIVTWNGLGFDFDILAEESSFQATKQICRDLALNQVDIAFAMFCSKGFMCGLDTAAKGMDLPGKTEGMHGDLAPKMWQDGKESQEKVLEYVAQDVRTTAQVYESILHHRRLRWITQKGHPSTCRLDMRNGRLLTVQEALTLPLPNTAWMTNPWPRSKFYDWTEIS